MKEKIFVTGASGLVGSHFVENFKDKYELATPEYPSFDLTDKKMVEELVKKEKPDVVVHFAAYTDVGQAENQRDDKDGECWRINVAGTENLLNACPNDIQFIQISTDMVFTGNAKDPGPYEEDHKISDDPNKVTWYGYTKAEAERLVTARKENTSILRLVYPFRSHYDLKLDYVRKILSLYDQGKLYPLFTDQQVSITLIDKISEALNKIIEKKIDGIFNAASSDTTTPFDLATYLLEKSHGAKDVVKPTTLKEFLTNVGNPVRYPKFGGLSVAKTEMVLGMQFGTWRKMIDEFVAQSAS